MSILTGPQIQSEILAGRIVIDPFDPVRLNPNSYNLRLASRLLVYAGEQVSKDDGTKLLLLDMKSRAVTRELIIHPRDGLILWPGVLYLGSTMEYTETMYHAPVIEGRSSIARLGLSAHTSAGFGDCGFKGAWTLELTVVHPVRIYPGIEICQIAYSTLLGEVRHYKGKYQYQDGPKASDLWKEV